MDSRGNEREGKGEEEGKKEEEEGLDVFVAVVCRFDMRFGEEGGWAAGQTRIPSTPLEPSRLLIGFHD